MSVKRQDFSMDSLVLTFHDVQKYILNQLTQVVSFVLSLLHIAGVITILQNLLSRKANKLELIPSQILLSEALNRCEGFSGRGSAPDPGGGLTAPPAPPAG